MIQEVDFKKGQILILVLFSCLALIGTYIVSRASVWMFMEISKMQSHCINRILQLTIILFNIYKVI